MPVPARRGRPAAKATNAGPAKRTRPAAAKAAPAKAAAPARKVTPAKAVGKTTADVTVYASKEPTDYHKAFATWIVREVGYAPAEAATKKEAFLMGVSIATAARPSFMESEFLEEWREKTGVAKRGPKPKDAEEETPAPAKTRRTARTRVVEAPVEEFDEEDDEFDEEESDEEFDDESDADDDESDEDEEDDEFEDDEEDDEDDEEEVAPAPRRGRPAKAAPAKTARPAAKRTAAAKATTRTRTAKGADDEFLF